MKPDRHREPIVRPTLGVVVVSYNTRPLLAACLRSLLADIERTGVSAVVWVVDNASTDGSAELVRSSFPTVNLIARRQNAGFAGATNVLLRRWAAGEGTPEWVLVLNPDTKLQAGALRALMEAASTTPDVAVAGPRLIYPDGRFQHSAFRFPGLIQTMLDLFPIARLYDSALNGRYPRRLYAASRPFEVDFPLGACLLVRGQALAQVGPLDERFFMYCEEIDWCRRFRSAGWRVLCAPGAVVVHHAGASTRQQANQMYIQLWLSRWRLFAKHEPVGRLLLLRALLAGGFRLRSLADRLATARGRLSPAERQERQRAYRAIRQGLAP